MAKGKQIIPLNTDVSTPEVIALLDLRQAIDETIKAAEAEKDAINQRLLAFFDDWEKWWPDAEAFEFPNGARLRKSQTSPRRSISAEKLLANGVAPDVLEAASTWSEPGKPFLKVDWVKTESPE